MVFLDELLNVFHSFDNEKITPGFRSAPIHYAIPGHVSQHLSRQPLDDVFSRATGVFAKDIGGNRFSKSSLSGREAVVRQYAETFQMLTGTLTAEGRTVPVHGKVLGEEVSLSAGSKNYQGRMSGKTLELR